MGSTQQAIQLKLSALHSLSASAKKEALSLAEAAQHVAASMLLGSFEVGNGERIKKPNSSIKPSYIDPNTIGKLRRVAMVYLGSPKHRRSHSPQISIARKRYWPSA
jgi:hypothetical protein